jgi:endonuclease VIII-like 1
MPELAELILTADYVNEIAKDKVFYAIVKNPVHKGLDISQDVQAPFTIKAKSRGKELKLELNSLPGSDLYISANLMMTMGMAGHFKWVKNGFVEKHAHLVFKSDEGSLAFVDVRRFGKWKWGYWGEDRGPDPINDFQNFVRNIKNNLHKKDFDKPICEVLMNQKYFNGIGNYLRAEILYRTDINPFMPARQALQLAPEIYKLCKWAPLQAYNLGGGQLKDWQNPFGPYKEMMKSWDEFMLCYGNKNMAKVEDRNGRTFWYDPKWKIDI